MLSIEEYIARRKKENNLDEFDLSQKQENLRVFVNYVFEYFNSYINVSELEEREVLKDLKIEKYKDTISIYEPEVQEWLVDFYNSGGKQLNVFIGNLLSKSELFYLFHTELEFRELSYELYPKIIRRFPTLKGQSEMIFLFFKEYHKIKTFSDGFEKFSFSDGLTDWLNQTRNKYKVNISIFAQYWVKHFYDNEDMWPVTHRSESAFKYKKYDYNYKQKNNLFNLDTLFGRICTKPFMKGRKKDLEVLMMYYFMNEYIGDQEYWLYYYKKASPLNDL